MGQRSVGWRLWVEGEIARRRDRAEARSKARLSGGKIEGEIERHGAIGAVLWSTRPVRSSDWSSGFVGDVEGVIWAPSSSSRACSLSLSLCVSDPEIVWSENFYFKPFPGSKPHFTRSTSNNFWKIYFPWATKFPHLWKSISGSDLKPKQTQPNFQTFNE